MFVDLREATTDDARAIARVGVEARRVGWNGIIADSYLDSLDSAEEETRVREFLADPEADWGTHVALTAEGVAGYITAGPTRGDDASPSTAHVAALFVAPEWFGQGVGTLLLADATDRLSKMGFSEGILWALEEDRRVRDFYEHRGWTPDGDRMTIEIDGPREVLRHRRLFGS